MQENLIKHNITLPEIKPNQALFLPFTVVGNQIHISGQLPLGFGDVGNYKGKVGKDFSLEQAGKIAEICLLNVIAQLKQACGGNLDKVKKCVKITVFVNSTPEFDQQHLVANFASTLLNKLLPDSGHARSAFGVSQLPLGVAVEIEAIFEIEV
jgi:enamine deaminase RidA (YjgF/YER057c/UK114 family)